MGSSSLLSAGRCGVVLLQVIFVLSCCCCCMGVRGDKNVAFSPCDDTTVEKGDGFTFGLLIGSNASFFSQSRNYVQQLSPCNAVNSHSSSSSSLYSNRLSVFRPKVDEISLLVVNYTELNPENFSGGSFAVVYAGSKFAAVSSPKFVANSSYHITSLSMVLEFDTGRLKTPIWKSDGCQACQGVSPFVCVNGECAIRSQDCKRSGGVQDCSLSIQLTWAGTDRRYQVFNSWYQINSLGQYSLYKLYTSLKDSLTKQYNSIFH
ncbi:hypothetical protein CY35_08G070300 [Sphagnum magellanicum]|nr:hypothetical protein CY35_08G070300 [Sphagnum magellanicum]KAH9554571.1 hypothetical protein CY35_08G070300 [Sphagnum magellanicum]